MMWDRYVEDNPDVEKPFFDRDRLANSLNEKDKEILNKLNNLIIAVDENLGKYRFADATDSIYHFMWDDLASDYIEHVKNREDKDVALAVLYYCMASGLKLLHPFMPFVTEEIWQNIPHEGDDFTPLIVASWPQVGA
jgi:valyl-tRNA synthetase